MHYLFYQHNVQQFFIRHIDKYDGILVPFSISASFPSGTYGFLRALLAKDPSKHFAMDPRSALFQHKWDRKKVREPHKKAAAIFGAPFTTFGVERYLGLEDFSSVGIIERVTEACIRYQRQFRMLQEERRKLDKYQKLLSLGTLPEIENPQKYIPPYFQASDGNDPWLEKSLACIEYAAKLVAPEELCPVIHFTDWERFDAWDSVRARLGAAGVLSYFVYPNKFKEHEASATELGVYVSAVESAARASFRPLTLHGGYFAIALQKKGLDGFGNGVGYGEWRDSGYHRGGSAEVRGYIPKLHRFLHAAAAQSLIAADAAYFTADSDLLTEYSAANKPLTLVQPQEALDHFMESRYQEIGFVSNHSEAEISGELHETVQHLEMIGELESENYGKSLTRWADKIAEKKKAVAGNQ